MKRTVNNRIDWRVKLMLICAALLIAFMCQTAFAARTMYTTDLINHRARPSSSSALLQTIPKGAAVVFLDAGSGGYYKVSYNGMTGYALASYLVESAGVYDYGEYDGGVYMRNIDVVNFRAEPSSSARLICQIPSYSTLTYLGPGSNDYYYMMYNGDKGYVLASYLVSSGPLPNSDYDGGYYYYEPDEPLSMGRGQWKTKGSGMKIRIKVTNESSYKTVKAYEIRYYPTNVWDDSLLPTDYTYIHTTEENIKPGKTKWSDYMDLNERKGVSKIHAYFTRVLYTDGTEEYPDKKSVYWDITW